MTIEHFRKTIDIQKKNQNEIQFQLKKLEELTLMNFDEMEKEMTGRINYLTEVRHVMTIDLQEWSRSLRKIAVVSRTSEHDTDRRT